MTERTQRLARAPHVQLGVFLPRVISGRLDALLVVAGESGERTSRREILAAIVFARPLVRPRQERLIEQYRRASVAEALVEGLPMELVLRPSTDPGPRQSSLLAQPSRDPGDDRASRSALSAQLAALPTYRYGFSIPRVLKEHLDGLEQMLSAVDTGRDELVAALILECAEEESHVGGAIRRYRQALVDDVGRPSMVSRRTRRLRTTVTGRRKYRPRG